MINEEVFPFYAALWRRVPVDDLYIHYMGNGPRGAAGCFDHDGQGNFKKPEIGITRPYFVEPEDEKTQSKNEQWALQALVLLDQAKKYLKEFKIDKGSKRFQFARRCEIYGMDDRERLAYAKSIYKEAEKFNEWRKDSIANLLCVNNLDITEAPAPEFLVQAVELKEEFYNNQNLTS